MTYSQMAVTYSCGIIDSDIVGSDIVRSDIIGNDVHTLVWSSGCKSKIGNHRLRLAVT